MAKLGWFNSLTTEQRFRISSEQMPCTIDHVVKASTSAFMPLK
jgi:hypothetical protein